MKMLVSGVILALTPLAGGAATLNPDLSLILGGRYASFEHAPDGYTLPGFQLAPETGPGPAGFGLAESELVASATIDDWFYGKLTLAFGDEGSELEESYLETLALGHGLTARGGRFYSALGYLNDKHPHAWDFADAPLAYRGLLGNQLRDDGVRLSWVAPTELFLQLGIEAGRGEQFPAGGAAHEGSATRALYAKIGGDIGSSHSWQLGIGQWRAEVAERQDAALLESGSGSSFSGDSRINAVDFVWKWAPYGDTTQRSLKLQAEYLHRRESGQLAFTDAAATTTASPYVGSQRGWYAQAVYQFMPRWRLGLRHDRLSSDNRAADPLVLTDAGLGSDHAPHRNSAMLDYSHSEYSRLRLQYALDRSAPQGDRQLLLQYIVSLGAHGAHTF